MRVLHVTDCFLPRLGGIELHVADLVAHQRAAGEDAAVLTATPGDGAPEPPWVRRTAAPGRPAGLRPSLQALHRALLEDPPDVVHAHVSVVSPFAGAAAQLAGRHGIPTLVTVHSMWSGLGPLPALTQTLLDLRSWPVVWSAVSDRAAQPLRDVLGPGVAVRVLGNAVDVDAWRRPVPPPPLGDVPTVVSVMRLARTKRPLPLARILRDVRDRVPAGREIRAVVIGDGPQRARLERYLRRHRMDSWVQPAGRLDRSGVRAWLDRASVFLAPAELESFGIAALEARSAGVPVVASSRSGVGEFVRHGVEGLLGADDDELAGHLTRLLTDEATRSAIAHHNHRVPPAHDWPAALGRHAALYAEAAVTAGAPRPVLEGSLG